MSVFFKFAVQQVGDGPGDAQKTRMDDLLASLRVEAIENTRGEKPAKPAQHKKPGKPEKQKKPAGGR